MMRLELLILLISASCVKMNCDEELSTTETIVEVATKTELHTAEPESLQSRAENNEEEKEASKASEVEEEVRVSRSSPNGDLINETQFEDSLMAHSTEISPTEKFAPDDVSELDKQANIEVEEPKDKVNPEEPQYEARSAEKMEKHVEELSETSASETENRNAEDILEASAESKLSDIETASSKVDENDRNSEIDEIQQKSDESDLNEGLQTRRMLSGSDYVVINTKMRADTTSNEIKPEVKTSHNQNLNAYNNLNEFGNGGNIKLTQYSRTEPYPTTVKTAIPVITKVAPQEILNQQYLPKFYPRPELNINFPNLNSDFQGPRDLPIYLKIKPDDIHSKNQFIEAQNSQFKSTEENTYFNTRNLHQYHQGQRPLDNPATLINKQYENLRSETRNQVAPENFVENKQTTNLNQDSRNQVQQFYHNQEKMNSEHNHLGNINLESINQAQGMVHSKISSNNNDQGNQYPLFRQGDIESKINVEAKLIGTERIANPLTYLQPPSPQQINVLTTPARYIGTVIPKNVQILFQKLASASEYPNKLQTLQNNNNIPYPYFINPNYRADPHFNDVSYMPGFQRPI